eukprot:6606677-Alexandrium_andersonii.AAC.1
MSASLVGSEMCIRDSHPSGPRQCRLPAPPSRPSQCRPSGPAPTWTAAPVSYTHLTLPTICSV